MFVTLPDNMLSKTTLSEKKNGFYLPPMSVMYTMYIISKIQLKEYIAISKLLYRNNNKFPFPAIPGF